MFTRLLVFLLFLHTAVALKPDEFLKRGEALRLIKDYQHSVDVLQKGVEIFGSNQKMHEELIRSLALARQEKQMLTAWKHYLLRFSKENRQLMEVVAWGIIQNASYSPAPAIRVTSLLIALQSQDMRGIHIIARHLDDKNNLLRQAAVSLASNMHDDQLKQQIISLLKKEKVWRVRMALIEASGNMKIKEAQEALFKIVGDRTTSSEEKATAIIALVGINDELNQEHVVTLSNSSHHLLRLLACKLVEKHRDKEALNKIAFLIEDSHPDVRLEAIQTLVRIAPSSYSFVSRLKDPNSKVAVAAAWGELLNNNIEGEEYLRKWLLSNEESVQCYAAALLGMSGKKGVPLMQEVMKQTSDPYVKMNLAVGLIGQRESLEEASAALYTSFQEIPGRLVWAEENGCRVIKRSRVKHHALIPQYPETVNQITRLELLNLLSIVKHPDTKKMAKSFIKGHAWGVTGMASAFLLMEGDESSMEIVEELLDDQDSKTRLQAALVLSMWGRSEKAIRTLEAGYSDSPREMKEKILEAVGRIGAISSVPFLLQRLDESHQTLRVLASGALIQCLYH